MAEESQDALLREMLELATEIASRSQDSRAQAEKLVRKIKAYSMLTDVRLEDATQRSSSGTGEYVGTKILIKAAVKSVTKHGGKMTVQELLEDLERGGAPFIGGGTRGHAWTLRQSLGSSQEQLEYDKETDVVSLPPKHR